MKYYIIAGEASGDLHGSNLMRELKLVDSSAQFRFWGGDLMAQQGGEQVKHYRDTAFMGIFEVISNLKTIKKNFRQCETDIVAWQPDVVVLVDYPGFNLRIAEFVHKKGFKTFYYISPKLWAWNTKRVKKVKAYVDQMFTILPFETAFYKKYDVEVDYCGNPVLDAVHERPNKDEPFQAFCKRNGLDNRPVIGILAGSRKQELARLLDVMLAMVEKFPDYQFIIAGAPSFSLADYQPYVKDKNVSVLFNQTYEILQQSSVAMVTSGTATLETALLRCPQVVCYRMWGGGISHWIGMNIIMKVPYISLVNLILNRFAVKELVQNNLTTETLTNELRLMLFDAVYRNKMLSDYDELINLMGNPGASKKAASLMFKYLITNN